MPSTEPARKMPALPGHQAERPSTANNSGSSSKLINPQLPSDRFHSTYFGPRIGLFNNMHKTKKKTTTKTHKKP